MNPSQIDFLKKTDEWHGLSYTKPLVVNTLRQGFKARAKDENVLSLWNALIDVSLDKIDQLCESEIEKQTMRALLCGLNMTGEIAIVPSFFDGETGEAAEIHHIINSEIATAWICPNMWATPRIRVDAWLMQRHPTKKNHIKTLIIECDSFQYHSSANQLLKEKRREREILGLGHQMLRFSGREIVKNPTRVAAEIMIFMDNMPWQKSE